MSIDAAYQSMVSRIPNWVGFGLIILAGAAAIAVGTAVSSIGLIAFGIAAVISAILAWYGGAKSSPNVNPFSLSFGGTVTQVPAGIWAIVFGLFLVAGVITIYAR